MTKKIIIGLSILLFILVILTIIFLRKKTPTASTNPDQFSAVKNSVAKIPKKNPTINQQRYLDQLQNGYETQDFRVSFSIPLNKYLVERKTSRADTAIQNWAQTNGLSDLIIDPDYFLLVENEKVTSYQPNAGITGGSEISANRNFAIASLPVYEQSQLESAKKSLPYATKDVAISYVPSVDTYIVQQRTTQSAAQQALQYWADANGLGSVVGNRAVFVPTTETPAEIVPTLLAERQNVSPSPTGEQTFNNAANMLRNFQRIIEGNITTVPLPTSSQIIPTSTEPNPTSVLLTPQPTSSIPNPPSGQLASVANWASRISSTLTYGYVWPHYYNREVNPPSNGRYTAQFRQGYDTGTSRSSIYWCTNIVIDAFNLAGIGGLGPEHQGVVNMQMSWSRIPGLRYVPYLNANKQQALSNIQAGCAIFWESRPGVHTGYEHTAILKTVQLDNRMNGYLETYESDNTFTTGRYPVFNATVQNNPFTLVGFGCT